MPDMKIVIYYTIDDNKPIDEQLMESSNAVDYIFDEDEDNVEFLEKIKGKIWKNLNNEQKERVKHWLFSDLVYPGVIDFEYEATIEGE